MTGDVYTDFPKLYSTDKKKIDNLLTSVSMYCRTFSYITVRDYIDLYRKISPGVEVKDGSIFWCI